MRVTERAQHAVLDAKQEAGRLGHDRVGTEHLLLGLLRDQERLAVVTLVGLGIQVETVRRRVEETVGRGQGPQVMGFYLPMTKPAEAQVFVARVRKSLSELEQSSPDFGPCTLSMGIAESPRHGTTVSSVLAAADTALYKAKRAGRNAVEVADG